jgi:hypothetical protein
VNTNSIEGVVTDLKYKALIMDTVHNMDVVQQLRDARIKNIYDWLWQKQLRFYLENNKAIIRMVDAQFNYTYEYQGNAQKLVHTPLTDKCYLTLTQGMHMGFGGNPVCNVFLVVELVLIRAVLFSMDQLGQGKQNQLKLLARHLVDKYLYLIVMK